MVKRNKKGQVIQRVPGEYSNRIFNFRVTEDELHLIKRAKKFGFEPRDVVLREAKKVLNDENK